MHVAVRSRLRTTAVDPAATKAAAASSAGPNDAHTIFPAAFPSPAAGLAHASKRTIYSVRSFLGD